MSVVDRRLQGLKSKSLMSSTTCQIAANIIRSVIRGYMNTIRNSDYVEPTQERMDCWKSFGKIQKRNAGKGRDADISGS